MFLFDVPLEHRAATLQAMAAVAGADGAGSPGEAALVEATAATLGVDEPRVANLRQLASGRVRRLWLDLTRKGYAMEESLRTAKEEGGRGLWKTFAPIVGLSTDDALAERIVANGLLPEGTLGRAYFEFLTRNGLPFPSEPFAVAERGLWHDLSHVLGAYETTPVDEALVVAFVAGFRREDPFIWLFTIALQFQVGLRLSPFSPGVPKQIDPRALVRHHQRGAAVRLELSRECDFRADWERPLALVRAELGVGPRDDAPATYAGA